MLKLDLDYGVPEWVVDVARSRNNWHGGVPVEVKGCARPIIAMVLGSDPRRECFNLFMCLNGIERDYLSDWYSKPECNGDIPDWCRPIYELAMEVRKTVHEQ